MANSDPSRAIFSQVDANNDGNIDRNEFRNWIGGAGGAGGANSASYQSSTIESSSGGLDGSAGFGFSSGAGLAGAGGAAGYEANSSLYSSQSGYESAGGFAAGGQENAYASAASSSSTNEYAQGGSASFESSSSVQQKSQYPSAGGLYDDPNPQFVRRAAASGTITYQQKIAIRFLQPPPVPPPGPLIIKEVRPPQPPPPPPLVIRQRAPALPQPPPLILRERPPQAPVSVASQTVIRRLGAIPVPPRSVIIERLPALPPRPRDIVIERWVPYGAQAKRRTIVQRAAAAKQYAQPRNVIIVYDAVQARVLRRFQRFAVTQENPQAYVARYGQLLLDTSSLVQQARAAGVVEDISTPAGAGAQSNASAYSSNVSGFDASGASLSSSASFEGAAYGADAASGGNYASQSYSSSSSYGSEGGFGAGGSGSGFDAAGATFAAADTNRDGRLDQGEFQRFVQGGL